MSDFAPVPRSALPGGRTSPGSGQLSGLAQTGNPTLEQPLRSPVQGQGHTVPFFFSFKESLSCHFRTKKVKPHNKTLNSKSRDGYSRRGLPVVSSYPTAPVVLGTMKLPVTEELGTLYAQVTQTAVVEKGAAQAVRGHFPGLSGTRSSAATLRVSTFQKQGCPSRSTATATSRPGPHSLCARHHSACSPSAVSAPLRRHHPPPRPLTQTGTGAQDETCSFPVAGMAPFNLVAGQR